MMPTAWIGAKMPSAVTVGGVPVATSTDGSMVYLGGGIFAAAPPPAERQAPPPPKKRQRQRILPGRVSAPPRPLGPRSAVRSASAHLVGPQTGAGELSPEEFSPCPSRARSDGQLGLSTPLGGLQAGDKAAAGKDALGSAAARVWRPSGPAKLPPPPEAPARRTPRRGGEADDGATSPGQLHSAARAEARDAVRRDGAANLFGGQGLLAQLRAGELAAAAAAAVVEATGAEQAQPKKKGAVGPPLLGEMRAAERRAAKEERNRLLLEEREMRLAAEAAEAAIRRKKALAPLPLRGSSTSASAPELREAGAARATGPEDIETAKMRLACKMEIFGFFNGYSKAISSMTPQQTKELLAKLNSKSLVDPAKMPRASLEEEALQSDAPESVEGAQTIQERLQQVNEMCNQVFAEEAEDFDL